MTQNAPAHRRGLPPGYDPVLARLDATLAAFRAADARPDPVLARLDAALARFRREDAEREAAEGKVRITDGDVTAMQELVADIMVDRVVHGDACHREPAIPEWDQKCSTMLEFVQDMRSSQDTFQRIKDDRVIRAMSDFRIHTGGAAPRDFARHTAKSCSDVVAPSPSSRAQRCSCAPWRTECFGAGGATVDFPESFACASAIAVASDFDPDARMAATAWRPVPDFPSRSASSDRTGRSSSLCGPSDRRAAAGASVTLPTTTGPVSRPPIEPSCIEAESFAALLAMLSRKAPSLPLSRSKNPPACSDLPAVATCRMSFE